MARTRLVHKPGRRRLSLEISEEVSETLENLRRVTNAESLTEVIRRSLAVYDHLWSEKDQRGAVVYLRLPDGSEEKLVLL